MAYAMTNSFNIAQSLVRLAFLQENSMALINAGE